MLTTLATPLAATLVAVTFGWVPSTDGEGADRRETGGYEYLVKLSVEDLEALRAGRAESLTSELPSDIGPIERVRVYLGEGAAPQRLTARDERSPKRIAQASKPERYVVAKPAVPEWDDAAALAANNEATPTAERRTAYQNRNALDPRNLADGFQRGTQPLVDAGQQAGRFLEDQTRELAQGTQDFFERSGENLRNGTRDVLNGTSDVLGGSVPRASDAYGTRPQYDANGRSYETTAQPPQPQTPDPRQADFYNDSRSSQPLREPATSDPRYNEGYDSRPYDDSRARGPELPARTGYDDRGRGLAEPFAGDGRSFADSGRRQLTSIPRSSDTPAAGDNRFDAFGDSRPYDDRRDDREPDRRSAFSPADGYDDRRPAASQDDFVPLPGSDSAGGFNDRFADNRAPASGGDGFGSRGVSPTGFAASDQADRDAEARLWNEDRDAAAPAANPETNNASNNNNDAWDMDRFMVVVLTAVTCFTLFAHVELRNKYRAALRGVPSAGYGRSAAA